MKKFWNELPWYWKLILALVAAILIFLLIRFLVRKYQAAERNKLLDKTVVTGIGEQSGSPISVDLGGKAAAIHDAFYDNDIFGATEDEERAITELSGVPKNVIPDLSATYYQLYSSNLKDDFVKYLSPEDWNRVADKFNVQ